MLIMNTKILKRLRGRHHIYAYEVEAAGPGVSYFPLEALLPASDVLVLDTGLGILSYLSQEQNSPLLLSQAQFSPKELTVIQPLLEWYPRFCPDEVMWASFNRGRATPDLVNSARERLREAKRAGIWDYEMRPLRNILSRARFKLRELRLDVRSILETGYLLISFSTPKPLLEGV